MTDDGAAESKTPNARVVGGGRGGASPARTRKTSFGAVATGSKDPALALRMIKQLVQAVWISGRATDKDIADIQSAMISAATQLGPRDLAEGMLTTQMAATHDNAMECYRRANLDNQSVLGRDMELKQATKLMGLYIRQLETLDKHRGRGQQKITVEHVTVNAGGQAIVGNVRRGSGGNQAERKSEPAGLSYEPAAVVPTMDALDLVPAAPPKIRERKRDGQ